MSPRLRTALGALAIIVFLIAYIVGAVWLGDHVPAQPPWLRLAYYAVAGVAWGLPLKPLFTWMNGPR
ncbi:MAG: DUF2842 domain-containing protein [Hyphomonadaceae bacterium]